LSHRRRQGPTHYKRTGHRDLREIRDGIRDLRIEVGQGLDRINPRLERINQRLRTVTHRLDDLAEHLGQIALD